MTTFTFEDPLIKTWAFHCGILMLKMLAMSVLTGLTRYKHKAFANPEDGASLKLKPRVDENVERIRRAHLNDIENIPTFVVASFLFVMTNPSLSFATMLFRAVTACRFLHTLVYAIVPLPQPSRGIAWVIPYGITIYMAVHSVIYNIR